jgi:hypothetical protein
VRGRRRDRLANGRTGAGFRLAAIAQQIRE